MSNRTISNNAIENKIRNWSKGYWTGNKKYMAIYDPLYTIPDHGEVLQFLKVVKQTICSEDTENDNIWDCDQYSRYLWVEGGKYVSKLGLSYKWSLGMISGCFYWVKGGSEAHTCNWVYTSEGFALIEPQTFIFYKLHDIVQKSIRLMIV
jgi:hypothetical protein